MPELPEIEVIRRGLQPHLPGRTITAIFRSGKNLRHPVPFAAMQRLLIGNRIGGISRRAKYLLLHMGTGDLLILHLGMSGRLGIFAADAPVADHDHVRWRLDSGQELRLYDPRRFGAVHLVPAREAGDIERTFFKDAGPEPLTDACSPEYLRKRARKKRQPVKAFLMDLHVIAGIGNIYANECLFSAGIHPLRPAADLSLSDWQCVLAALRDLLQRAIACGGSTISDYLDVSGKRGLFQFHFRIYGKKGQACPRCQTPIATVRIGGRASYFCPECQKE